MQLRTAVEPATALDALVLAMTRVGEDIHHYVRKQGKKIPASSQINLLKCTASLIQNPEFEHYRPGIERIHNELKISTREHKVVTEALSIHLLAPGCLAAYFAAQLQHPGDYRKPETPNKFEPWVPSAQPLRAIRVPKALQIDLLEAGSPDQASPVEEPDCLLYIDLPDAPSPYPQGLIKWRFDPAAIRGNPVKQTWRANSCWSAIYTRGPDASVESPMICTSVLPLEAGLSPACTNFCQTPMPIRLRPRWSPDNSVFSVPAVDVAKQGLLYMRAIELTVRHMVPGVLLLHKQATSTEQTPPRPTDAPERAKRNPGLRRLPPALAQAIERRGAEALAHAVQKQSLFRFRTLAEPAEPATADHPTTTAQPEDNGHQQTRIRHHVRSHWRRQPVGEAARNRDWRLVRAHWRGGTGSDNERWDLDTLGRRKAQPEPPGHPDRTPAPQAGSQPTSWFRRSYTILRDRARRTYVENARKIVTL